MEKEKNHLHRSQSLDTKMEFAEIAGTPLKVSRIAIGTWAIGGWMWGGADERQSIAAIREGDEARMTVELALLRSARPEIDPSRAALTQRHTHDVHSIPRLHLGHRS